MSREFDALVAEAAKLIEACRAKELKLATAESCTGGLIAAILTEVAGASDAFECGFVTYSNAAKTEQLGVPAALIEQHGAVSAEVACAMATGALQQSQAHLAVAVTGVAGPSGGTAEKPVGLVHLAAADRDGNLVARVRCCDDIGRSAIRRAAVSEAFRLLHSLL